MEKCVFCEEECRQEEDLDRLRRFYSCPNCGSFYLPLTCFRGNKLNEKYADKKHITRFWAYLRQAEPQTDLLYSQMRNAWKQVPIWAHRKTKAQ